MLWYGEAPLNTKRSRFYTAFSTAFLYSTSPRKSSLEFPPTYHTVPAEFLLIVTHPVLSFFPLVFSKVPYLALYYSYFLLMSPPLHPHPLSFLYTDDLKLFDFVLSPLDCGLLQPNLDCGLLVLG